MATISNATTGNDILVPTNNDVTYRGLSGDDVYILSSAIAANAKISIVDTAGANRIQLVDGLSITSSRFAADAVELTLSNGAVVTINGADNFTFEVGGNDTSGTAGTDQTYSAFAEAMGVSSLPTGSTLVSGTANVAVSGASIGAGVGAGSVSILTTGYDELTGGAGNDTYIGVIGSGTTLTANSYDVIDGGDGTDTVSLNLSDGDFSGDTTITNVEIMSFRASGAARTSTSLLQQEGVTQITNDRSTDDLTVAGVPNIVTVFADRVLAGKDTRITYDLLATIGTGTTQPLTVTGSGAASVIEFSASGTDGVETVAITSTGSALGQTIGTLTVDDAATASTLTKVTLAGESKLTITNALDFAGTAVGSVVTGTIDLSASTGGSALTVGADAENIAFTGGSGNDKITFAATFNSKDTVDGGDGTDTLALSGITSFNPLTSGSITNTEIIQIEATNNNDLSVTNFDKTTATAFHLVENDTDAKDLTLSTLKAGDTVGVINNNDNNVAELSLGLKDASGSADVLNVELYGADGKTGAQNGIDDIIFTAIETLNITSDVVSVLGNEQLTTTSESNLITDISADTALTTVNVSGNDKITLTVGAEAALLSSLDASGMTYDAVLTTSAASAVTVKLGSGNDTINFGTTLTGADTVTDGGNRTATTADRLTATISGLSTVTGTGNLNVSGVENIDLITATSASSVSAANITGATVINAAGTAGDNTTALTITNLPVGTSVGVGNAAAAANDIYKGTLTVSLADETGSDDNITFLLGDTGTDDDVDATLVTNAAVETVTITASADLVDAAGNEADLNVAKVKASTLVINGGDALYTEGLDLTGTGAATLHVNTATVNAAAHKGPLTLKANAATPTTVTAQGVAVQTITGGAKNDVVDLTVAAGTATHVVDGGAGSDTIKVSYSGDANVASIDNFETLEVTVGASKSVALTQAANKFANDSDATTLIIKGGNSLSTFSLAADPIDGTNLTLIDGSAFEGRINNITFDAEMYADTTQIIGGSSAKDTVKFSTDTDTQSYIPNTQSIEYLYFTSDTGNDGSESTTLDLTKATDISRLYIGTGTGSANTVAITNYNSANHGTIYLGHSQGGTPTFDTTGGGALSVAHASATGTSDTVNLFLEDTDNAASTATITSAGTETLNITVGAAAESHSLVTSAVTPTTGSATTINVKGYLATASAAATVTLATTSALTTTVDAGTFAGTFTLSDRGSSAMTITGSIGADSIQMENGGDTIASGTGVDTLVVKYYSIISGITVDLSAADQIVSWDGAAASGTVSGFEKVNLAQYTGGFGGNVTMGSSTTGSYEVTGTKAADSITFGLGADNFIYDDDTTLSVDTINNMNLLATGNQDTIDLDLSVIEGLSATTGSSDLEQGDGTDVGATDTVTVTEASAATDISALGNDILVLVGATYSATTDVETALEAGGNRVLTVSSDLATVGGSFLVLYSDGTDAYVAVADVAVETADDTDFEANDLAVTNILKIAGVSSIAAGDFADAEFDIIA